MPVMLQARLEARVEVVLNDLAAHAVAWLPTEQ